MAIKLLSKGEDKGVEQFIKVDSKTPLQKVYGLFATDFRKAPKSATSTVEVAIESIDETRAAPTGKQFANANVICGEDGIVKLHIPSPQFNLKTPLVFEDGEPCSQNEEDLKRKRLLTVRKIGKLYTGVENRVALMGFGIIKTGKLTAHGANFDFGNSFIVASTATEKYAKASFDVMDFINDKLIDINVDKVIIPFADIKNFKAAIKDCPNSGCLTKGFIKPSASERGNLAENGYTLVGYHEDTMTPIYAINAKVTESVRDETTGEVKVEQVTLLESGQMLFIKSGVIRHKFGAIQAIEGDISIPKRTSFRRFKNVDEDKGLTYARLQTAPTPYLVDDKGLLLVTGLK